MLSFVLTYSNLLSPIRLGGWSTLFLQNGKCAELLPFVKLLHSYGLCPLDHQPYFPILQHCGINDPTKKTGLRGKAKVKELRLEVGL